MRNSKVDALPFFAALIVLLSHWFGHKYLTPHAFGPDAIRDLGVLYEISSYGILGVDIFFVVSGAMIARSAIGREPRAFFTSRFLRLAPIYIPVVFLAMAFNLYVDSSPWHFGLQNLPGNLFLIAPATGSQWLDGSYWTLWYELRFYLMVGTVIWLFAATKNSIRIFATVWLVSIVLVRESQHEALNLILMTDFGPLFISGIFCAFATSKKEKYWAVMAAIVCGNLSASSRVKLLNPELGPSPWIVYFLVMVIPLLVATFVWWPTEREGIFTRISTALGLMSYPLYLLHQTFGIALLNWLRYQGVTSAPLASFIAATFLLVSVLIVTIYFEPRAKLYLKNKLLE
jgi:peptidoglycan/LPS O-acetylase OafA/YrhL